jgi:hypothetical protein
MASSVGVAFALASKLHEETRKLVNDNGRKDFAGAEKCWHLIRQMCEWNGPVQDASQYVPAFHAQPLA